MLRHLCKWVLSFCCKQLSTQLAVTLAQGSWKQQNSHFKTEDKTPLFLRDVSCAPFKHPEACHVHGNL